MGNRKKTVNGKSKGSKWRLEGYGLSRNPLKPGFVKQKTGASIKKGPSRRPGQTKAEYDDEVAYWEGKNKGLSDTESLRYSEKKRGVSRNGK